MDEVARRLLVRFQEERNVRTTIRDELQGGHSGALVALVDCQGQYDGIFILKIGLIPSDHPDEEYRHRKALEIGAFAGKIPEIVDTIRSGHHYLLLQRLAGGSRIQWRPLVESIRLFSAAYGELGRALWTPSLSKVSETHLSGSDLVRQWLDYMIDSARRGRIKSHVGTYLSQSLVNNPKFSHLDQVLPNPLYFVLNPERYKRPTLAALNAPSHGDCHARNVLVKAGSNAQIIDIALIDFASFASESPFFFDYAYFELSTLLRKLSGLGDERWFNLARVLSSENDGREHVDQGERGWADDVLTGRILARDPVMNRHPDRRDDIRLQFVLAQVAAGLAFLNKRPPEGRASDGMTRDQYQQAFVWAAVNLQQFLEMSGVAAVTALQTIPTLGAQREHQRVFMTEEEWASVGGFNANGMNILVLSSAPRQEAQLRQLMKLPWTLIVDFNTQPVEPNVYESSSRMVRQAWPQSDLPRIPG